MRYCSLCVIGLLLFCFSSLAAQTGFDWPVDPDSGSHRIGNSYGQLQAYEGSIWYMHTGLDIMVPPGTPVYAVTSGYVKALLTTGGAPYWSSATSRGAVRTRGFCMRMSIRPRCSPRPG